MTKEQQDFTWKCLPKEVRDEIKDHYIGLDVALSVILSKEALSNEECDRVKAITNKKVIYEMYLGRHNLTSDKEPEELLFVEKEKVQDYYKTIIQSCEKDKEIDEYKTGKYQGALNTLYELFGDKYLSNKGVDLDKLNKKLDEALEKETSESLNEWIDKQQSVQGEPEFKVGDKVKVNNVRYNKVFGAFGIVKRVEKIGGDFFYTLKNDTTFRECYFEPYTEPKFNVGDKFRFKKNPSEVHTVASIFPDGKICFWEEDADGLSKQYIVNPEYIVPYTEPETKKVEDNIIGIGDYVYLKNPQNEIEANNTYRISKINSFGVKLDKYGHSWYDKHDLILMKKESSKSILPGDLIEIKGKETNLKGVVIELTDSKYVKVQPIGLTCTLYIEQQIVIKDNPELYGK